MTRNFVPSKFTCVDCRCTVYGHVAPGTEVCASCNFVRNAVQSGTLDVHEEIELRRRLGCERRAAAVSTGGERR